MNGRIGRDVLHRCAGNPLVTLRSMTYQINDICNAGVVKFNGEYLLLVTVETLEGTSGVYIARSTDGRHFTVDRTPFLTPSHDEPWAEAENIGIRDVRVTPLDGTYYLVCLADGEIGFRVEIARTDDFVNVERISLVGEPDVKNGALFPRKINGRYALLERPDDGAGIWISYSDDLVYWGSSGCVMTPRGGYWDNDRIGAAAPPIEIEDGWLLIYYGVKVTGAGPVFRLGAAILDSDDPLNLVARSNIPLLSPRERYERIGDLGNLVFSCGALLEDNGELLVYYGGSDSCICLATASLDDVVHTCRNSRREW